MMGSRRRIASCLATLALAAGVAAHGGEDHGAPAAAVVLAGEPRVVEAVSPLYEAVIKFRPADEDEPLAIDFWLTEYATNAPVAGAVVRLSIPDLQLDAEAVASPKVAGLYEITATPGRAGTYSAIASIQAPQGADLLVFDALIIGPEASPDHEHARRWPWIAGGVVVLAGLILLVLRRRARPAALAVLIVALPAMASAHGDDDHGAALKAGAPAAVAVVTKEAQLAFGIRTQVAQPTTLAGRKPFRGTVMAPPNGKAEVIAPQAGRVVAVAGLLPTIGDSVRKGQALASIEGFLPPEAQLSTLGALADAEARSVAAAQELGVAQKQSARVESLPELMSARQREEAAARLATARAADEGARRGRDILRSSVGGSSASSARYVLQSPIDGVVSSMDITLGEAVEAGRLFFTIVDTRVLWIRVDVPESDPALLALAPGSPARIEAPNGRNEEIVARLVSSGRSVDAATRTIPAWFEAGGTSGLLLEGQLVNVMVETGAPTQGYVVPASAIVNVSGRTLIFAHVQAEEFAPREVVLGVASGDTVEVLSGLQPGDRIVTEGAFQVRAALLTGT